MKTIFLKNSVLSLIVLVLTLGTLASCNKDDDTVKPTLKESIVGTWDISSYKLGGSEYIGLLVESASIQFHSYTGLDGLFVEVVKFLGEEEEELTITGTYSVDESKGKIYLTYDGDTIVVLLSITGGNKMTWESSDEGYPLSIKATKRP